MKRYPSYEFQEIRTYGRNITAKRYMPRPSAGGGINIISISYAKILPSIDNLHEISNFFFSGRGEKIFKTMSAESYTHAGKVLE